MLLLFLGSPWHSVNFRGLFSRCGKTFPLRRNSRVRTFHIFVDIAYIVDIMCFVNIVSFVDIVDIPYLCGYCVHCGYHVLCEHCELCGYRGHCELCGYCAHCEHSVLCGYREHCVLWTLCFGSIVFSWPPDIVSIAVIEMITFPLWIWMCSELSFCRSLWLENLSCELKVNYVYHSQ